MVVKKDHSLVSKYYHPEFLLFTNGEKWDYEKYLRSHEEIYATPIQYMVRYDEETFVEHGSKLAARVFITIQMPEESPKEIEVILIAEYKDDKLYRLWELTYPDWSKMSTFESLKTNE